MSARPTWCPRPRCRYASSVQDIFCAGMAEGGLLRLCMRACNTNAPVALDDIDYNDLVEVRRMLDQAVVSAAAERVDE